MLEPVLLLVGCALFGVAVVSDLTGRWIPDSVPLGLLAVFAVYAVTVGHMAPVWGHMASGAVLLLVGFVLFMLGGLGGGRRRLRGCCGGGWNCCGDCGRLGFGLLRAGG